MSQPAQCLSGRQNSQASFLNVIKAHKEGPEQGDKEGKTEQIRGKNPRNKSKLNIHVKLVVHQRNTQDQNFPIF